MSERPWTPLQRRQLSRRSMLNWSARAGVGAAGIALVGCGDDDEEAAAIAAAFLDEPEPVPAEATEQAGQEDAQDTLTEEPAQEPEPDPDPEPEAEKEEPEAEEPEEQAQIPVAAASIVFKEVRLLAAEGSLLLANVSDQTVNVQGWWLCKRPAYWQLPDFELAPGQEVRVWVGNGEDTATDIFAARGFGTLGSSGEIALYRDGSFSDPSSMVAYVGWGNGGGRISEARRAGLWGDDFVQTNAGDVICRLDSGLFADGYQSMPAPDAPAIEDDTVAANGFGPVIFTRVYFDGNAMIEVTNLGSSQHCMDGYWLCQFPSYLQFPRGIEIPAGGTLFINTGSGSDTAETVFANGGIGELNPEAGGELGLYRDNNFGSADSIASYVGWNGGGGRLTVAQAAGIFADPITVSQDDVVIYSAGGFDGTPAQYTIE